MNILLIGLDSRKDQHGNDLPKEVLDELHAGDSDAGGYNTNTLILVHVGADDKVVAFSIPRDDYVAFNGVPGYHHIKIKEAYGLTKAYVAQKLADEGVQDQQELETKGREAGRKATIKAVRSLTGVPIDYFAEINLASFYDLAQSLGSIEVEGQSGAGMVKVQMTCKYDVRRVSIDPSVMDDREMLEDLLAAAVNDAVRRVEETSQSKMSGLTAGLNLPPGFKLPF